MSKKKFLIIFFIVLLVIGAFVLNFKIFNVTLNETGQHNDNIYGILNEGVFSLSLTEYENYFFFDTEEYEDKILKTGLVEEISVEKDFPEVIINLKWRTPIISLESGNSNIILDKDGYVLYIVDEDKKMNFQNHIGSISGVIVKSARIGEPIITENDYMLENAVNLYLLIVSNKELFTLEELKPDIKIDNDRIVQVINKKYYIDFGDGSEMKDKFSKAVTIYNKMCEKQVTTGIINVSRKNHYVYETWED